MRIDTTRALDEARAWTAAGHFVVAIPRGGKRPRGTGWEQSRLTPDDLPARFTGDTGLGLLLGITGLIDVDLDCAEARVLAPAILPPTKRRHGRAGAPESHWWYRVEAPLHTSVFDDPGQTDERTRIIEVRGSSKKGTPQQTIIPPTIHPNGEPLVWSATGEPEMVLAALLLERAALLAACVVIARAWPAAGNRHAAALHLAGVLCRRRLDTDEVAGIVEAVATTAGDEEADRRREDACDTCRNYLGGVPVSGLPQLLQILRLDPARRAAVGDWLGQRDAFPVIRRDALTAAGFEIDPASAAIATTPNGDRPLLNVGEQDLAGITPKGWEAVRLKNEPPRLFRYGGTLVRLQHNDSGAPVLVELEQDRLRHELARAAWCIKLNQQGVTIAARPPKDLVTDMLALPDPPLPVLTRVVEAPVFAENGVLQTKAGYHPASRTFYAAAEGLHIPTVSANPSGYELEEARALVLDEFLIDFPFVSQADRAGAVALFVLAYCRDCIPGPTPNHLIEAPEPGSGKSLLAETAVSAAVGRGIGGITEARDDDEWRKRITAVLREGAPVVLIDNVRRSLDSSALASALTQTEWRDRLLGRSETITLPIRCVWVTTANNPTMTTEMARRCIRIRLDAKRDQPWRRPLSGFRHSDLRSWARRNRGRLVWAALTLIRHWFAQGQPPSTTVPLGSYEEWTRVVGGVLHAAGIAGLLENLDELYADVDTQGEVWRTFVALWWEKFGDRTVSAGELFSLTEQVEGMAISGSTERGMKTSFGQKLAAQRDRVIGNFRVTKTGTEKRLAQWRLMEAPAQYIGIQGTPDVFGG